MRVKYRVHWTFYGQPYVGSYSDVCAYSKYDAMAQVAAQNHMIQIIKAALPHGEKAQSEE